MDTLKEQLRDPYSKLYAGSVTCSIEKSKSIEGLAIKVPLPPGSVEGPMSVEDFTTMVRHIFDEKDVDGSRTISNNELKEILREILAETGTCTCTCTCILTLTLTLTFTFTLTFIFDGGGASTVFYF